MNKTKDQIQKEAGDAIDDLQCSGVVISMGVGKTRVGLKDMIINYTDYTKYLVVTPTTKIQISWLEEMVSSKCGYLKDSITFSTYRSLTKQSQDYDVIYLDECHSLKKSHEKWLDAFVAKGGRIVGLTGTYPVYMGSEKGKLCAKFCPKVYSYETDEAVEDNILNNYEIVVHKLKLSEKRDIAKKGKHGEFFSSEKKDYDYWSSVLDEAVNPADVQRLRLQRMKVLQGFKTKLRYSKALLERQKDKTLIFVSTKAQADLICKHSVYSGKKSSDTNLEKFKSGEINKLSAIDQLSEGVNIPNLKVGIINHAYANNRKSAQKIGRFLRLNPNEKSTIHVLCYENSVDKGWVEQSLESFDSKNIKWISPMLYEGIDY